MKQLILVLSILYSQASLAFINIESLRQELKKGFYGSSGFQVSGSSGNSDVFEVGGNSQNIFKEKDREYLLIANYKYGEATGLKNTNEGDLHLRFAKEMSLGIFAEVFTQVEFNEFQALLLRSLTGGGGRFRLVHGESTSLFLGVGLFYEDEDIDQGQDQSNFRGNTYLSLRSLIGEGAEAVLVVYYQPNFKNVSDHRFQGTAGLEIKINETWSTINSFSYAFDSRPPLGIKSEDSSFSAGLNYSY